MVGSSALIIVLSVFNGIEGLVVSLFNTFDPHFVVEAKMGKSFSKSDINIINAEEIPGIVRLTEVIEDNAVVRYKDKQSIVKVRGYSNNLVENKTLDSMMIDGSLMLTKGDINFAVLGAGVAYGLGANSHDKLSSLQFFAIGKDGGKSISLNSVNQQNAAISGVFSVQQDFDVSYVLTPLRLAAKLFGYNNRISYLEVWLTEDANQDVVRQELESVFGDEFLINDRFQQQKDLYKIMRAEKWAVFIILAFIILVSAFNIISSLTLLILDKRKDISILSSMGANLATIRLIFIKEGVMISVLGALAGMVLGTIVCLIQIQFGIVGLGSSGGSFVVDAYPVIIEWVDFLAVFIVIAFIGIFVAWFPVRQITNKSIFLKL